MWVPDVYFYSMKDSKILSLLTKFAGDFIAKLKLISYIKKKLDLGLYFVNGYEVLFSQEIHFTFWCPMRFSKFPLDTQVCKFQVKTKLSLPLQELCYNDRFVQAGSYAYSDKKLTFNATLLEYDADDKNTILDYDAEVAHLNPEDTNYSFKNVGNFSLTGKDVNSNLLCVIL